MKLYIFVTYRFDFFFSLSLISYILRSSSRNFNCVNRDYHGRLRNGFYISRTNAARRAFRLGDLSERYIIGDPIAKGARARSVKKSAGLGIFRRPTTQERNERQ